jgi:hypothetical protein
MNHDNVNLAAVAILVLLIIAGVGVWFFLPEFYNDESESGVWYKEEDDDYNLNRNECIEIFRKHRLCFRVREEDIAMHDNNNDTYDENNAYDVETGDDETVRRTKNNEDCIDITESCDDYGDDQTTDSENSSVVLRIPQARRIDSFKCSNICVICHEKYKTDDEVVFSSNVKCDHVFHIDCMAECISQTKGSNIPCPCCRQCFLDATMFCSNVDDDRKKKAEEKATMVEDGSTTAN